MAQRQWKIVALSDTHNMHDEIQIDKLPQADFFIHAGDFTMNSTKKELDSFRQFIEELPYKHKVVVSGNHDIIFDPQSPKNAYSNQQVEEQRQIFKKDLIEIEGVRILGINKRRDYFDWMFNFSIEQGALLIEKYKDKVDILITHWPPYGILDQINKKQRGGSKGLLEFVKKIKPKIHIFGHIHQNRGECQQFGINFYNASNATKKYELIQEPTEILLQQNCQWKSEQSKQQ